MFLQKIMLLIIVYFGIKSITRRPMAALLKRATHIFSLLTIFLLIIVSGPSNVSEIWNTYSTTAERKFKCYSSGLVLAIALTSLWIKSIWNRSKLILKCNRYCAYVIHCLIFVWPLFGLCLALFWSLLGQYWSLVGLCLAFD